MKLIKCYMNNSSWLKAKPFKITVKGVLIHSTGANNPTLKRYCQPDNDATNRKELLKIIGINAYNNDYNHIRSDVGVSFWIGKLADGSIATIQAGPDNIKQWGCGGSLNNTHIQVEICEDNLKNKEYFNLIYNELIDLCVYLCEKYNIDPLAYFTYNKKKVSTIIDHAGSYKLGMGSNHSDIGHWFSRYLGDNYLEKIKNDINSKMKGECEMAGCPYWKNGKCTKETKTTTTKKKTNTEIAKEVIAGKWGNGEERKKRLKEAGYNYEAVQKIVNKLI